MLEQALRWVKCNIPDSCVILGGQYASLKREILLSRYGEIDYIVAGDGEFALPLLINGIVRSNGRRISDRDIPNLLYLDENGELVATDPKYEDIESMQPVAYKGRYECLPYISTKGCVYHCSFCAQSGSAKEWRYLSADRIYEDWRTYQENNGVKHITVADSTFFLPYSRMERLLELLPPLGVTWEANIRADTPLNEDMVARLEAANCIALSFGFESMNDKVLAGIRKRTTALQNRRVNRLFARSSIDTHMSFIVGFPGETTQDYRVTLDYLLEEHYGHCSIYAFEFENTTMPIWEERERYQLELYDGAGDGSEWGHEGLAWRHVGMDSETAISLREATIREVRNGNSEAICYSWQRRYQWPLIPTASRQDNLKVEKLVDRLVYIPTDYSDVKAGHERISEIMAMLGEYGVTPSGQ